MIAIDFTKMYVSLCSLQQSKAQNLKTLASVTEFLNLVCKSEVLKIVHLRHTIEWISFNAVIPLSSEQYCCGTRKGIIIFFCLKYRKYIKNIGALTSWIVYLEVPRCKLIVADVTGKIFVDNFV